MKDLFIAAREVIKNPENWTQGCTARDKEGVPVNLKDGCSFCTIGALAVAGNNDGNVSDEVLDYFRDQLGRPGIIAWNDSPERTHAEVLAQFDKVIDSL